MTYGETCVGALRRLASGCDVSMAASEPLAELFRLMASVGLVEENGAVWKVTSPGAKNLLRSLLSHAQHGLSLVDDWDSKGVDVALDTNSAVLSRAASLVAALETRRQRELGASTEALDTVAVTQAVFTAQDSASGELAVLVYFDSHSSTWQPISSRCANSEPSEDDLRRTIQKEFSSFPTGSRFKAVSLGTKTVPSLSVSRSTGVVTSYVIHSFLIMSAVDVPPRLGGGLAWATRSELSRGQMSNGDNLLDAHLHTDGVWTQLETHRPTWKVDLSANKPVPAKTPDVDTGIEASKITVGQLIGASLRLTVPSIALILGVLVTIATVSFQVGSWSQKLEKKPEAPGTAVSTSSLPCNRTGAGPKAVPAVATASSQSPTGHAAGSAASSTAAP